MILSLDLGTTHIKALLWNKELSMLRNNSVSNFTDVTEAAGQCYDPAALLGRVTEAVRGAISLVPDKADIIAVGITGMADSGLLVDGNGSPLTTVIPWTNPCGAEHLPEIAGAFSRQELYHVTGQVLLPKFSPARLLWYRRNMPEVFNQAAMWISLYDYLLFQLTGSFVTDASIACRTMLFDIRKRRWSARLCRHFGVEGRLPKVIATGETAGRLTDEAAARLGLSAGIPVVCGGHDHPCALYALNEGTGMRVLDSMGTSEVFVGIQDSPSLPDAAHEMGIQQGCFGGGYYWLASFPSSGASIEWFRRILSLNGQPDYTLFTENNLVDSGGVLYSPKLNGSGAPDPDGSATGSFLGLTSQTTVHHMVRAIHEGLAYQNRLIYETLASMPGCTVHAAAAAGGGGKNRALLRAKADITGKPVRALQMEELTGFGAALAAAKSVGLKPQISLPFENIKPSSGCSERYDNSYRKWLAACNLPTAKQRDA